MINVKRNRGLVETEHLPSFSNIHRPLTSLATLNTILDNDINSLILLSIRKVVIKVSPLLMAPRLTAPAITTPNSGHDIVPRAGPVRAPDAPVALKLGPALHGDHAAIKLSLSFAVATLA